MKYYLREWNKSYTWENSSPDRRLNLNLRKAYDIVQVEVLEDV